jgi:MFS family permease
VCLVLVGLLYGYSFTSFAGVAQQSAPNEMRGRVLAVNSFVLGLLFPVGTLVQGAIADTAGLRWVTAASGIALLAVSSALALPYVRRTRQQPAVEPAGLSS